jgi:CheY-like chemotaxis protein
VSAIENNERSHIVSRTLIKPSALALVADDNEINRLVAAEILSFFGVDCDMANDGMQAVELAASKRYDIILMDCLMPVMDGYEATARIHSGGINQATPIVALTANSESGAREIMLAAGFDAYLPKPLEPEQLDALLLRFLPKDRLGATPDLAAAQRADEALAEGETIARLESEAGLNCEKTIGRIGGSVKTYLTMLRLYLSSEHNERVLMKTALHEKDYDIFRIKIHAQKSALLNLGAEGQSELARVMEFDCIAEEFDRLPKAYDTFIRELDALIARIAPILGRKALDSVPKLAGTAQALHQGAADILVLISELEVDLAQERLTQMRKSSFGREEDEALGEVYSALELYDFDTAEQLLHNLNR